jgi:hypothetical protein
MMDEDLVTELLVMLLARNGGKLSFSDQERAEAKGMKVVYDQDPDKAQFTHLYLIPDYVAVGEEDIQDPLTSDVMLKEMLDRLKPAVGSSAPTITANPTYQYVPSVTTGTVTTGVAATGTVTAQWTDAFDMKLSAQGAKYADKWAALQKNMYSIGWDPAGQFKEISMADAPKTPAESTPPPAGGGLPTTDPTFANQGGSAPKESKPAKKSDVTRKR